MKKSNRMNRINEELKKEISHIINQEMNNTNITGMISVTSVETTADLKYAKVFISIISSKNKKNTLAALKKSSGFIRTLVAKRINLRTTPELIFEFDESIEYGSRIDKIISEISKELKPLSDEENGG